MRELAIRSERTEQLIDITQQVKAAVRDAGVDLGSCSIYCPHTTAGLLVNEGHDPAVGQDLSRFLRGLVPDGERWEHAEGNAPAHIKATLVGTSVWIPIEGGELRLGRWQAVFFAEFDGPRDRRVWLQIVG